MARGTPTPRFLQLQRGSSVTPSPITSRFKSWVAPGIRDQRLCEEMRSGQSFFQRSCCSVEEGEGHTGPRDARSQGKHGPGC